MVANDPSGRPSLTKLVATTGGTAVEQLVDSSSLIDSLPKGVTNVCNGNKPLQQNATVHSPIAIVGVACRLPGHCTTPHKLWDFITAGSIANANSVPESRFSIDGHYDGSLKPHTMRSPGGMCLEDIDLHAMDAQFFNASRTEAIAMDPQQRQLLEVVYECLENGGITLESISGKDIGCFVGSYAVGEFEPLTLRSVQAKLTGSFTLQILPICKPEIHLTEPSQLPLALDGRY